MAPDRPRRLLRAIKVLGFSLTLAACGGGGGGDPGTTNGGGTSIDIVGRASVLGGSGSPERAPSGLTVQWRSMNADGSLAAPGATTTTGADGAFSLRVTSGSSAHGTIELVNGTQPLRALAWGSWVEVSPASEALFQEVSTSVRQRGSLPSESAIRLARFATASTQFLHLTDVHAASVADAVQELRAWLTLDPAAKAALDALRATGSLPPTLGDIGGLHGLGKSASVSTSSAGTISQVAMRYRLTNGGEFDVWESKPGDAFEWLTGPPDLVLRLSADGFQVKSSIDRQLPLDNYFGGVRIALFGVAEGNTASMVDLSGKTAGATFDNDSVEDDFQYTSTLRTVGYESITHDAQSVRTLHLQRLDRVVVSLSTGGSLQFEQTTNSWHAPFGGALKTTVVAKAVDAAGVAVSGEETSILQSSSINGMGWPGRVHVQRQVLTVPQVNVSEGLEPLVAPTAHRIVFTATPSFSSGVIGLRVLDTDSSTLAASVNFAGLGDGGVTALRVGHDQQSIFAAASRLLPSGSYFSLPDMPLAEAQALSAQVVQFNAADLTVARRVQLPAAPSSRLAGRGYPRARIDNLLVSPIDNSSFAAAAAGLVLFGSSSDTPAIVVSTDSESDFGATGAFKGSQVDLHGWDAITNDLHFYFRPFWSFTQPTEGAYKVPASAATFALSNFSSAPNFFNNFGTCCLWSDTGDELYTQAGILMMREPPYEVRARDGSLVVSANASPASCSTITGRLICSGSELAEFDLSTMKARYSFPLNSLLRNYAGEPAGGEVFVIGAQGDGALVAASRGYVDGGIGKIDVVRIRTWPMR